MPVPCAKDAKIALLDLTPKENPGPPRVLRSKEVPLGDFPLGNLTRSGRFGGSHTFPLENRMSMADRDGKIWMDGKLIDWRDAKIHVLTHTLHYGMGVFEGVRAYKTGNGTSIFRLKDH